jgi:hypothetical protein
MSLYAVFFKSENNRDYAAAFGGIQAVSLGYIA